MTRTGLRGFAIAAAACLTSMTLVACNGPTTVDAPQGVGGFNVGLSMDPQMLNPPQLSTINYTVTDAATGKPVAEYEPVAGALFHNVLISRDLTNFKHSYTNRMLLDSVSLLTYFPVVGKYYSFGIFEPAGAGEQLYAHTVEAGEEGPEPNLVDNTSTARGGRQYGLRIDLLKSGAVRANQEAQLAFFLTEQGRPVSGLWPFLGAPGYLWIIDQEGKRLEWETGTAPSYQAPPTATVEGETDQPEGPRGAEETALPQETVLATVPASTQVPPTLEPGLVERLATRTAEPQPSIAPVQLTAQASVLEPQVVRPDLTYGPYVVFTHTFEEPGLYKMWFEFLYRGAVVNADWVIQVEP